MPVDLTLAKFPLPSLINDYFNSFSLMRSLQRQGFVLHLRFSCYPEATNKREGGVAHLLRSFRTTPHLQNISRGNIC